MSPLPTAKPPNGVVVGRFQGTVMVTVHGELDSPKVAHLRLLLTDLIDDQGNVSVVVDLQDATAALDDPGALGRFADSTKHEHGHHAVIVVDGPSTRTLATRNWFNDDAADAYEPGGFGADDSILGLTVPGGFPSRSE